MACRPLGIPLEGQVNLGFRLDQSGHLIHAVVTGSSGLALLDRAALLALRRAAPFPSPPAGTPSDALDYEVQVRFGQAR